MKHQGLYRRDALLALCAAVSPLAVVHAQATDNYALQPWYVQMDALGMAPALLVPDFAPGSKITTSPPLSDLTYWASLVLRLVVKYQQNPLRAARVLSYVQVAMHDAWVWSYKLGGAVYSKAALAAVHQAASLLLEQLYPNEVPGQFEAQRALLTHPLNLSNAQAQWARRIGTKIGQILVERSLRDGSQRVWSLKLRPAPFSGIWQPTYPLFAVNPLEGAAGQWTPWVARSAARYQPPIAFRPGSAEHSRETLEVLQVSSQLTDAQKRAALDWNLDAGSVTPGGVWMQIAIDELTAHSAQQRLSATVGTGINLGFMLRVLASLSVALHDAFIACWYIKLRDWSERPITAIQRDLDPRFRPLLVTPGFPSYVSGHATVSAAAATVLAYFLPQNKDRYMRLAQEAAASRLWGGIHFASDNAEGLRLGYSVGADVIAQLSQEATAGLPATMVPTP